MAFEISQIVYPLMKKEEKIINIIIQDVYKDFMVKYAFFIVLYKCDTSMSSARDHGSCKLYSCNLIKKRIVSEKLSL